MFARPLHQHDALDFTNVSKMLSYMCCLSMKQLAHVAAQHWLSPLRSAVYGHRYNVPYNKMLGGSTVFNALRVYPATFSLN